MQKTWDIHKEIELAEVVKFVYNEIQNHPKEKPFVLALYGDLGAGKTTFMQALAQMLGVEEVVTSPTFVIQKKYTTRSEDTLVHIDAYRIESVDEMKVLGFEELLAKKNTIIGIEWAERVAELLPQNIAHLQITQKNDVRHIEYQN